MMALVALRMVRVVLYASLLFAAASTAHAAPPAQQGGPPAQNAQWIWSSSHDHFKVPAGTCYFRKSIQIGQPQTAHIEITADDSYELYINGQMVGSGQDPRRLDTFDIAGFLVAGRNVVAVKVTNADVGPGGLVARLLIKEQGGTQVVYTSNGTWKTRLEDVPGWNQTELVERGWDGAQQIGPLGVALPWGKDVQVTSLGDRFQVMSGFRIEWVIDPAETGSLLTMTFNEFGQIIAARENGPLLLITDKDKNGVHETVTTYCEEIKNCHGLLALNGQVFAIGDGPKGSALYRLRDKDRDGQVDDVKMIVPFESTLKEHGAHALALGPDGMIYIMLGNHARLKNTPDATSPYHDFYEGDLLQPRHEDPGGHAVGIKAPGGTVARVDLDGKNVELYAGGLRNAYDLAFNRQGELFTYDSDMESDMGMPWYRPTRVCHLTPGAELGWRSGWANWPEFYHDSLPGVVSMGEGSPTGMVFYNHFAYPVRFHNAMFACDWSLGQIRVVQFQRASGTYSGRSDVFLQGKPLSATGISVGPDGAIYFCTGGRDTEGGIYRITWDGKIPPEISDLGKGISQAIRQPQLYSAWARQRIAKVQTSMGDNWGLQLQEIALSSKRSADERVRALDLLQLFGPAPTPELLLDASSATDPQVRAKATYLMGLHANALIAARLGTLLDDTDPTVRRQACESIARSRRKAPVSKLLTLLGDPNRFVAYSARRALEKLPAEQWQALALEDRRTRVFLEGATGLLISYPSQETAVAIVDRCLRILKGDVHDPKYPNGFVSDDDFTCLLRVLQLAIMRGELIPAELGGVATELAREYPSKDTVMNRELLRLLVYLQAGSITGDMIAQLKTNIPDVEKMHISTLAPFLKAGWTTDQKMELLGFYEEAKLVKGGGNFGQYVEISVRNFCADLTEEERISVIEQGSQWPGASLSTLARLPADPGDEVVLKLIELDKKLAGQTVQKGDAISKLRLGIVAVLGRSGKETGMAYLRELFEQDAARRAIIAVGLAQHPDGDNWPLLIESISSIDGAFAVEVLTKLTTVDVAPEESEPMRQVILLGLKLKDKGGLKAVELLEHWVGESFGDEKDTWETALAAWQTWFIEKYPDQPRPELPTDAKSGKYTMDQLLQHLKSPEGTGGNAQRGLVVFEQAQCFKCHRYGERGESFGPDLSSVSRRLDKQKLLESIVFPSHVISDQYASKTVITDGGKSYTGLLTRTNDGKVVIVQSTGEKVTLEPDEIEQTVPSSKSMMPEGLLDPLTLEQIADLFAYMSEPPRTKVTSRRNLNK